jgi:hypothetical protein
LADGVLSTIAHTYKSNLSSEIGEQIQHYELLVDIASLLKVVDKKITWFTRLDVLILIYHYFFFTTNSLAHQPTTSQYLQPLALQCLVVLATVPGYPAAVRVWNRTGWSSPGCYPENRGTHRVRGRVGPEPRFHITVPATLAPIKYVSSDRIMT